MANTPQGIQSLTPYITVHEAARAIDFYGEVFGAKEIGRVTLPNGLIGHAELRIEDCSLFISDLSKEEEEGLEHSLCTNALVLYLEHCEQTMDYALKKGCTLIAPVEDRFYGAKSGSMIDPYGIRWILMTHYEELSYKDLQERSDELFGG